MKYSLVPASIAALFVLISPLQALAGESQASTSAQFGGETENSRMSNSNSQMENNHAWGLDANNWGNGGANGQEWGSGGNGTRGYGGASTYGGGFGGYGSYSSGSGGSSQQTQSYNWPTKYQPYSYNPPAQYRSSQARVGAQAGKATAKKPVTTHPKAKK
jgi:hypothetical protein